MIMSAKEYIKNARVELGLNRSEFADLVGTSRMNISYYELGNRNPSAAIARKIVDKLKEHNIILKYRDLLEN